MAEILPYSYIIGLEIHVELKTVTKMFCRCLNQPFGAEPNQHTCPVCLGLPGALPVPNREAVRTTIIVGKALGSRIDQFSKWDRKHYFYPDLPKGYQISQYDQPLCSGGELALLGPDGQPESVVHFERIHLEEDAGKLLHGSLPGYTQVDLNRAGVPLIEMVTKPDLRSPEQARRFMQELRILTRTLGVSDADMEKGQMRCDVNVTITFEHEGQRIYTPITEIKNVNSTRAVERSLVSEAQRQYDEWMSDGPIRTRTGKVTAGWDETTGKVRINRSKEAAHEYRYFPEPDLPPLAVYELEDLNPDRMTLPELPNARRLRYREAGLNLAEVEVVMTDSAKLAGYETLVEQGIQPKIAANWMVNFSEALAFPAQFRADLINLVSTCKVSFAAAKKEAPYCLEQLEENPTITALEVVKTKGLLQDHDEDVVQLALAEVLKENPQAVQDFRDGKERILGFLVGQVMKRAAGKAQPARVQEAVQEALHNHSQSS